MNVGSLLRLALCIALCLGVGAVGARTTYPEIPTWYAGLAKPSWNPPAWVFPVVWNTLYVLMGISLWRLWRAPRPSRDRTLAITLFFVQLVLNAAWTPVFFALHQVGAALVIIALMAMAILGTMIVAHRVDRLACWLLAPYLAWVAYASTLNAGILMLNG